MASISVHGGLAALWAGLLAGGAFAQPAAAPQPAVLFENVRIFDGMNDRLSPPSNVLVVGHRIARVSAAPIAVEDPSRKTMVVAGDGRTLTPGLIGNHAHLMFANVPQMVLMTNDITHSAVVAAKGANEMMLRGFTSARGTWAGRCSA
jgi:imidazolonepropionase-like amidohydrolase